MNKKWIKDGIIWNREAIVLNNMRIWNPSDEQLIEAGYEEYVEPTPAAPSERELIENARSQKLAELYNYDNSSAVNSFTIDGNEMWLTVNERQQIALQINANEAVGRTEMTKWFNGNVYTFSIDQWKQMLAAVEVYAGDALNVTESHKNSIKFQMRTVEEIQNYDFTEGYPEKLAFNSSMPEEQVAEE